MKNILLAILIFTSYTLKSQDSTNIQTYKFKEVEVTDSRTGVQFKSLGKQVEIITQKEIQKMPVSSVDELLRYLPGIEIQSRGMFGTQADISMRGGTYNQTLILLDGVRIGDPMTGHFNSNIPISMNSIRRIEVIKGASSTIYGADAVGGVINIVTYGFGDFLKFRNPSVYCSFPYKDTNSTSENIGISPKLFELSVGDYSTYQLNTFIPFSTDNIYYDFSYSHAESYGYPAFQKTHNYGFNINTATTSINFKLNDDDFLAFRLAADIRDFDAKYFYTASTYDKSKEKVSRFFGQSKLKIASYDNHNINANLGIIYTEDNFVFNPDFTANNHSNISGDLNIYDQINLANNTDLSVGTEVQMNKMKSNDRGNRHQQQFGLYAVGVHNFNSDLNINAGVREEYLPTENWEFVPTIGANYYISDKIKLRANAGKSIRTPDYTERYVSTGLAGILSEGRNLGNPDLLPEISWNYEAGTDIRFSNFYSLSLTGYLRNSKNIIDYGFKKGSEIHNNQNLNPDFNYLYAQNIATLKVKGVEFKFEGKETNSQEKINLNWYLGGNILAISVADNISSKYITNAAGVNLTAGIYYALTDYLKISTDAIYRKRDITEEQSIEFGLTDEYFVMDGKLTYSWEAVNFDFTVKNIFDKQYSDILGVQLPGRWLMLGVNISDDVFFD